MEHIQEDSHRIRHRTSSYCIAPHTAKAQSTWRVEERLRISVRPKSVHSPRQRLHLLCLDQAETYSPTEVCITKLCRLGWR